MNGDKKFRIILIICTLAIAIVLDGCNRRVGLKATGQPKTRTTKCKCKKKVGIYSQNNTRTTSYYLNNENQTSLFNS